MWESNGQASAIPQDQAGNKGVVCVCGGVVFAFSGFFHKCGKIDQQEKKTHKTNQPANKPTLTNQTLSNFSLKIKLSLFVEQPQYKDFLGQPQDAYNSKNHTS